MSDFLPILPTTLAELLADLKKALGDAFNHRNDPKYWTAQVESGPDSHHAKKAAVTVVKVSLEATGFTMTVRDAAGAETEWHGSRGHNGHPVKYNGNEHNEANVVLRYAGSPANPVRFHLDIRWVKLDGTALRLDTQFPKN